MNIIVRAPLLSISGYGVHSRQIFRWLESKNIFNIDAQVLNWGNTSWMINPDMEDGLIGRIMASSKTPDENKKYDISFQVQLPDEWDANIANINIGISAVVETDVCNPAWLENMNQMNYIIVPSTHVKRTIENTGEVSTPILVIPEWYYEHIENSSFDDIEIPTSTSFNFFMNGTITGGSVGSDRKNTFNALKWFCEAFEGDQEVGLIIKSTVGGRGTRIDRRMTEKMLKECLSQVRPGEFPKVYLLHGNLTSREISSIYQRKDVKCLVSLTRGEGFGLPLLEAAASGLPVMTTNWSGHLDFLQLGRFLPINYDLHPISEDRIDNRIFLQGMRWAEPNEEDFKRKVVKLRNKYEMPKSWAQDLKRKVRENFSSKEIMIKYDTFLDELLGGFK
jgi:glycosyltransferase involved in cell wall biosynthesis